MGMCVRACVKETENHDRRTFYCGKQLVRGFRRLITISFGILRPFSNHERVEGGPSQFFVTTHSPRTNTNNAIPDRGVCVYMYARCSRRALICDPKSRRQSRRARVFNYNIAIERNRTVDNGRRAWRPFDPRPSRANSTADRVQFKPRSRRNETAHLHLRTFHERVMCVVLKSLRFKRRHFKYINDDRAIS